MGSIAEQNQRTKISRYCPFNKQDSQELCTLVKNFTNLTLAKYIYGVVTSLLQVESKTHSTSVLLALYIISIVVFC
jgi:hypothetical protein